MNLLHKLLKSISNLKTEQLPIVTTRRQGIRALLTGNRIFDVQLPAHAGFSG